MTRYSKEQLLFLKHGYLSMQVHELTDAFNAKFSLVKSAGQIKSTLTNHQFKSGRKRGNKPGIPTSVTPIQFAFIKEQYRTLSLKDLTIAFNQAFKLQKSENQIRALTKNHRVKSGRNGQFIHSHKPWNKGTKGLTNQNTTSFKKNHIPANITNLGTERTCSKDGYILIKCAEKNPFNNQPTRYRPKHQVIWEAEHGQIPKNMIVRFKDGNKLNCTIDNLELINRQENLTLNKMDYNNLPEKLKPTAMALAGLDAKRFDLLNKKG